MVQKGPEKQNPPDQRARGKNPQHQEGKDNLRNQQKQAQPPAPQEKGK
jgi:hypothetical protein